MTEAMLQSIICEYFKDKHPNLMMWSSLNGVNLTGKTNKYAEIMSLKKQCMVTGVPDLYIALPNGKSLHIELKTKIGKQSKVQKEIENNLTKLGHKYYICRSLKEFKEILSEELRG